MKTTLPLWLLLLTFGCAQNPPSELPASRPLPRVITHPTPASTPGSLFLLLQKYHDDSQTELMSFLKKFHDETQNDLRESLKLLKP